MPTWDFQYALFGGDVEAATEKEAFREVAKLIFADIIDDEEFCSIWQTSKSVDESPGEDGLIEQVRGILSEVDPDDQNA